VLSLRNIGKLLMLAGIAGFIASTIWWYMFFEQMLGESVQEASECFYQTTVKCEVGNLVGQVGDVPPYSPASLWLSGVIFIAGVLLYGLIAKRR